MVNEYEGGKVQNKNGGSMRIINRMEEYAERELRLSGMFDDDADYDGMLASSVLELIRVFSEQGHSGSSAQITIYLFTKLAMFQPLTPLTGNAEEWVEHEDGLWQSKRKSTVFSRDYGQTWYDLDKTSKRSRFWRKLRKIVLGRIDIR